MWFPSYLALALLSRFAIISAQDPIEIIELEDLDDTTTSAPPSLAVSISTSFPNSEFFGITLVNGRPTTAALTYTNNEAAPITIYLIGGALQTPPSLLPQAQSQLVVRNLTAAVVKQAVAAGETRRVEYKFKTEPLHPQELQLQLATILQDEQGAFYTVQAFNETVRVVEAPTSFFDPQIIFLYLVLLAAFAGTAYFIYTTWITTLFPQQRRRAGKDGSRARTSTRGLRKVDPADQVSVVGADGPAVAGASGKAYDEAWIPAHHLRRPEVKKARSGAGSVKTKSRAV